MSHLSTNTISPIKALVFEIIGDYHGKGGVITGIITPAQAVETQRGHPRAEGPREPDLGSRPLEKGVITPFHPDFYVIISLF